MNKPLNLIFIGLSGSGKGTQVQLIAKRLEHNHPVKLIITGDLFRALKEIDTDVGHRVKKILTEGGLPFDDLATTVWMHEVAYTVKEEDGIIFDGAPRRLQEAKNMDSFLDFVERRENTKVIYLHVSPEEITKRLLARKREDDTLMAIENRIEYFEEKVVPALEYYREQGRLIEIDADQSVEKVHQDIVQALGL